MRILLLTQIVPYPLDSGPKIKTHYTLRYLAQEHEVHLVCFVRSAREEQDAQALQPLCSTITTVPLARSRLRDVAHLGRSFTNRRPFLIERDDSQGMRRAIQRLMESHSFDAVHADQLSMAQFAVDLALPLRILDEHNAVWTIVRRAAGQEANGLRRALAGIEWSKLRAYEGEMCRRFDCVTVVSEEDRLVLEEAAGAAFRARVIPIAVDTDDLVPVARSRSAQRIVSVATMFYPPNADGVRWFADEVFPRVRGSAPVAEFWIVGSRPPASVTAMAAEASGIVVTGYVSDLLPILQEAAALVVPVRAGSGIRVKILEAFARGIPVVSTTVGMEGIQARPGEHLLVADEPDELAAAVLRLLREPELGERLTRSARQLVQERYDWRTALGPLGELYAHDATPPSAARSVGSSLDSYG